MGKAWSVILALAVLLIGAVSCGKYIPEESLQPAGVTDSPAPVKSNFNFIFKYGIGARNELDTFKGTYIKDMIIDASITVKLSLSEEEMERIYQKMMEIDFFSYLDRFKLAIPAGEPTGIVTPYSTYYFKVEHDSQYKELWWGDEITNPDEKADKLRELITLIRNIIESKEEYKKLPEPRSGYL
jgi:hypothetical protein